MGKYEKYYVPEESKWPIIGALGLGLIAFGAGTFVQEITDNKSGVGLGVLLIGLLTIAIMLTGWFQNIIHESNTGLYSKQMDRSFRQGMMWFIFSEVMFFVGFFGALFYIRFFAIPWLGGAYNNEFTNEYLWPDFVAHWPLTLTPDKQTTTQEMPWQGLPICNTVILLLSSITLHVSHVALEESKRKKTKIFLGLTVLLGVMFLALQVIEYRHAYNDLGLTFSSGVYGNTFFILTGFHGMHVTLGAIMLTVMLIRLYLGHFSPKKHFGFLAASWYWHFVDVVWLCLFIFVYVI